MVSAVLEAKKRLLEVQRRLLGLGVLRKDSKKGYHWLGFKGLIGVS